MEFHLNGNTFIVIEPKDDDDKLIETCAAPAPWNGAQCMFPPGHGKKTKCGFKADIRGYEGGEPTIFSWGKDGESVTPRPPSNI